MADEGERDEDAEHQVGLVEPWQYPLAAPDVPKRPLDLVPPLAVLGVEPPWIDTVLLQWYYHWYHWLAVTEEVKNMTA